MEDPTRPQAPWLKVLLKDSSPLRAQLIEKFSEFLLEQPVEELVEWQEVQMGLLQLMSSQNTERLIQKWLHPGFDRHLQRSREHGESLGTGLSPELRKRVEHLVATMKLPQAKWAQGAVDPTLIRRLFAPVIQQVLLNFTNKLPLVHLGGSGNEPEAAPVAQDSMFGGFANRLKRKVEERAEKLVDVGRKLGAGVDKKIQQTARDFSQGAMNELRDTIRQRLKSEEGQEIIAEIRKQFLKRVLETPLAEYMEDLKQLPRAEIEALIPDVMEYNRQRPFVHTMLEAELRGFLKQEGKRSLRDVLTEYDMLAQFQAVFQQRGDRLVQRFLQGDAFQTWMTDVLKEE
jgi:hypothetical protein